MKKREKHSNTAAVVGFWAAGLVLIAAGSALAQSAVTPSGSGMQGNPYLISEVGHLVWMSDNAADSSGKYYTMTGDIDAWGTESWNDVGTDTSIREGFRPIGDSASVSFKGIFDGSGYAIAGLTINRSSTIYVGLFGYIGAGGRVRNLVLMDCAVEGDSYVGSVAGWIYSSTVSNVHVTGAVIGYDYVGGLVGLNSAGTVTNDYAAVTVTGTGDYVGGLVGYSNYYGQVTGSNATVVVTGSGYFYGGLVGGNAGTVSNAYAAGTVTGNGEVGGLVGKNLSGTVTNAYATGTVTGTGTGDCVGGLVGTNSSGTVSNSYATGNVAGHNNVGGLVGFNSFGTVTKNYSIGAVTGSVVGGLVGKNYSGTVSSSYWDTLTSGCGTSSGGTGKTTDQMMQQATFVGWDFITFWNIAENATYPYWRSPSDYGDFNHDGYVNQQDLEIFIPCGSGPEVAYDPAALPELAPGCTMVPDAYGIIAADFDRSGDVDQLDFSVFQLCLSGTKAANPNCKN